MRRALIPVAVLVVALLCEGAHAGEPPAVFLELRSGAFKDGLLLGFAEGIWRITVEGEKVIIEEGTVARVAFGERPGWFPAPPPPPAEHREKPGPDVPGKEAEIARPPAREGVELRPKDSWRRPGWMQETDRRRPDARGGEAAHRDPGIENVLRKRLEEFRRLRDPDLREHELKKREGAVKGARTPREGVVAVMVLMQSYKASGIEAEEVSRRIGEVVGSIEDPETMKTVTATVRRLMLPKRPMGFGRGRPGARGR